MKRFAIVAVVAVFGLSVFGCSKKESTMEELQEPVSMTALSNLSAENTTVPSSTAVKPAASQSSAAAVSNTTAVLGDSKSEALPPQGPYKPTGHEIQTALKNAGFYAGTVDGKVGPLTKKAVEEFQKANNLKADGKVGTQTWIALSKYLSSEAPKAAKKAKKVKK